MKLKRREKKVRVQFDFTKKSIDKLDEMVERSNASSRSELFRNALSLYLGAMDAAENGEKVGFIDDDGKVTLFQMPL